MKNNELTEVKSSIPSLEGLPQEVIEYVHGVVAENVALKVVVDGVIGELYGKGFKVIGWHLNGDTEPLDSWFEGNEWYLETPATDAAITEIKARGVDELIAERKSEWMASYCEDAEEFAANLRAGRKG